MNKLAMIAELQKKIDGGFSKSQLENEIGLPRNCLSAFMANKKRLSKASMLKTHDWLFGTKTYIVPDKKKAKSEEITSPPNKVESGINEDEVKNADKRQNKSQQSNEIPPMPVRMEGEDGFDYAARKNEWKKKYNQ